MNSNKNMVRVATVIATGEKFLVNFLMGDKTVVWGQLSSFRGLGSKHQGQLKFLTSDVTMVEVEKTIPLLKELFEQGLRDLREQGFGIRRTPAGNAKIYAPGTFTTR